MNSSSTTRELTLRDQLRAATHSRHELLDGAWESVSFAEEPHYARFLSAQLAARLPIERWCETNAPAGLRPPETTGLLIEDLSRLAMPYSLRGAVLEMPAGADPANAALGLAWAVAGSHLGNRAILARLRKQGADMPASFLEHAAMIAFWRSILPLLDKPAGSAAAQEATDAANAVFDCFAHAMGVPCEGRLAA